MSSKPFVKSVAFAAAVAAAAGVFAQEGADAGTNVDEALQTEIKYVEALVDAGLPDFAQPVIAAAKAKWPGPEAETQFFAIEIRAMLSLGDFDGAEKLIAALPDRNGSKYWAARLEVANNFFAQGKKKECSQIYDEFFKKYPTPPKELKTFYLQSSYAYGQILIGDKQYAKAAERYEGLLKQINKDASDDDANIWCNVACETVEIYLRLASAEPKVKDRAKYLNPAKTLVDQLLWEQDRPVYFGRAIAFLAHTKLLGGDIAAAQSTIDDYMDQLAELHNQIKEVDPEGRYGLLKQSPMPQCRFMLAEMLWAEAQKEAKVTPKRDDEKIKALMFGDKVGGKRNGQGAFNHSLNVFVQYPESAWAAKAGEMSEAIREFAEKEYGAKIKSNVTPEQMAKVRAMQFRGAHEKLAEGDYDGAIADFNTALAAYPEGKESIAAVEALAKAYGDQIMRNKGNPKASAKIPEWRMNLDAIEGYISERFAGNKDRTIMTAGGDATLRLAAVEKQRGEATRADALQKAFFSNYRQHATAPSMAAAAAGEAQKAEKWADAIALWELFGKYYKKDHYYATSLSSLAYCYEKAGERAKSIETLKAYIEAEQNPLRSAQAKMNLAMTYQKDGFEMMDASDKNEDAQAAAKELTTGCMQIVRGIKEFQGFAKLADERLADPSVSKEDKASYLKLKEAALFLAGDSWRRLKKPVGKFTLDYYRQNAAANLETYVQQFPRGKYATKTYVLLGTLYTAIGDMAKSRDALDRLSKEFPESEEAKNAKPQLAKSLIEMGMDREATEIYAEMLRTDGNYTVWDFVRAGEALIDAKSWSTADQAFEKAIAKANTNQQTAVARARIGQAKSLYRQKNYVEAREALDAILENEKLKNLSAAADANFLLVDVASEQGKTEKSAKLRNAHFGAAMGALKRLRNNYWAKKPQEERDKLDLMSAEIRIRRMDAEEAMGLKEDSIETGGMAATSIQAFLQSHAPTPELPIDQMNATQVANLERGYTLLVPLLSRLGADKGAFVLKFGQEYMDLFPNGAARTEIQNCINQAKASGAVITEETEAAAAAAAAQGAAEEAAQPAEVINVVDEAPEGAEETPAEE